MSEEGDFNGALPEESELASPPEPPEANEEAEKASRARRAEAAKTLSDPLSQRMSKLSDQEKAELAKIVRTTSLIRTTGPIDFAELSKSAPENCSTEVVEGEPHLGKMDSSLALPHPASFDRREDSPALDFRYSSACVRAVYLCAYVLRCYDRPRAWRGASVCGDNFCRCVFHVWSGLAWRHTRTCCASRTD